MMICPTILLYPPSGEEGLADGELLALLTVYVTVPLPVPLAPPVIVIQSTRLAAVQWQLPGTVTFTLPLPPLDGMIELFGKIFARQESDGKCATTTVESCV